MSRPLLPLPLVSIERLHWFDDPPAFPNNIFARLTFSSPLDESLARAAFQLALTRHARGRALVENWRGRLAWIDHPELEPDFVWHHAGLSPRYPALKLERQPGCRVVFEQAGAGCRVTWQVHHALVDGLAGLQFVRDWMVCYDNLHAARSPEDRLSPLEPERLRQRNHLGLCSRRYLANLWRQPIALFGATKFLWRGFRTIGSPGIDPHHTPLADDYPAVQSVILPREMTAALRRAAVGLGVTTNSLLLAAGFQATNQLLETLPVVPSSPWLRMIVPISIRTPGDIALPAANRASLVQLDRRPQELSDAPGLAQGIDFELGLIRRWQLDRMFLIAVRAIGISDHWLRARVQRQKPRATTMITNLGRPLLKTALATVDRRLLMGNALLQAVEVIAPIRAGMPLSLAVVEYAGELAVTAHYDSRVLTGAETAVFLQNLQSQLALFV